MNQVTKPIEFPQAQFIDKVDDMLVDAQRQISPMVQTVQKTIETLLQNKILRVITKNHVTKYLEMLAETAELKDDRKKFYERLVNCMKFGIRENSVDEVETAELLKFNTSKPEDEQISSKEYVDRMKERLDLGEELKTESEPLKKLMNEVLGDKVEEMIVSNRMIDSLRVFTTSGHGLSANMERIMKAQAPRDDAMHIASGSQQQVKGGEWETVVGKRRKKGERDQEGRKSEEEREAQEGGGDRLDRSNQEKEKEDGPDLRQGGCGQSDPDGGESDGRQSRGRDEADPERRGRVRNVAQTGPERRGRVRDNAWEGTEKKREAGELRSY